MQVLDEYTSLHREQTMRRANWRDALNSARRVKSELSRRASMWLSASGQPSSAERAEDVVRGLGRRQELEYDHPWVLFPLVLKASAPRAAQRGLRTAPL